jgi:class 3 adenylate cyclase
VSAAAAATACAACGLPVNHGALQCPHCQSPALPAQRRVVTVLFADLEGYTTLCASLDPEDVHLLIRPLMNALKRVCVDLGGTVPVIEGDGLMAVFGALHADGDEPERAVIAAGQMRQIVTERRLGYGPELPELRVGANVGEVLVAPSWEPGGFSMSGDPVNVASRLCGLALPGGVLVAKDLADLVPTVDWPVAVSYSVRNREQPVLACALPVASFASRAARRPLSDTPWSGREHELAALSDVVQAHSCAAVVGDAGVGKSRLVAQWLLSQRDRSVVSVGCTSFDAGGQRGLLASLAEALLPLVDRRTWYPPAVVWRRLARLTGSAVDTDDTDDDQQLVDAVGHLVAQASIDRPLVLLIEDVHWASATTELLLASLIARLPELDVTLVVTSRSQDLRWPLVRLAPMSAEETLAMVTRLLPGADPALLTLLESRTGGMPLFVEQCVDLLLENGSVRLTPDGFRLVSQEHALRIPTAMRLFVAARLDLLAPSERSVLATASVLGDRIDTALLLHLAPGAEDDVEALVERGLLRWGRPIQGGPVQLAFRHALVRDVAYETELKRRRAEIHIAASEWYAVLPTLEIFEVQAVHLEAALALGDPDCDLVTRTFDALVMWASSIVVERPRSALDVLRRAHALVESHPACRLDALKFHLVLGEALELEGDEVGARASAAQARSLALARDDKALAAEAALLEGRALVLTDPQLADAVLADAEQLCLEVDDRPGAARVAVERAILLEGTGGWRALLEAHTDAFRTGQRFGDSRLMAHAAQQLAYHSVAHGAQPVTHWTEAALGASRPDDEAGRVTVLLARAGVDLVGYDLPRAVGSTRVALVQADAVGISWHRRNAKILAVEALVLNGDLETAQRELAGLEELAADRPNELLAFNVLTFGALLASRTGRQDVAREQFESARAIAERVGLAYQRELAAYQALVLLERGYFAEARDLAEQAARMDDELGQPFFGLRPRLLAIVARAAERVRVPLGLVAELRNDADRLGSTAVLGVLARWLELDDALRGLTDDHGRLPEAPDSCEVRALELELGALHDRDPARLLLAAEEWSGLGTTVWRARALLWHSELTGERHPEASELLALLDAPQGLEQTFRAQARGLKG